MRGQPRAHHAWPTPPNRRATGYRLIRLIPAAGAAPLHAGFRAAGFARARAPGGAAHARREPARAHREALSSLDPSVRRFLNPHTHPVGPGG
jgi:hypothetical protein